MSYHPLDNKLSSLFQCPVRTGQGCSKEVNQQGGDRKPMDIRKVVSTNIKKYRKEKGLTQLELAIKCGWKCNSNINRIEVYAVSIRLDNLEKIAHALDLSVIDLVEDWS